jgi:hypothetical protein
MIDGAGLKRDEIWLNRHRAFSSLIEHDLFGKPLHAFPDHALARQFKEQLCPSGTLLTAKSNRRGR